MKLAVSGKGGVGKTTIAAGLVKFLAAEGYQVYAVDADPDLSLGQVLGLPEEEVEGIKPLVDLREVIARQVGGMGAFYSLNPEVDDLLEEYSVTLGRVSFLKMGAVKQGGSSCYCRENSVLNAVIKSLLLKRDEAVVLDMGAGIEHLTRGTADGVDLMLVVSEPSRVSVRTARVVEQLAHEIGVKEVGFVGNKVRNQAEEAFLRQSFAEAPILGLINFSGAVLDGALEAGGPEIPELEMAVADIGRAVLDRLGEKSASMMM